LDVHRVLALNVPVMKYGRSEEQIPAFYKEVIRRIGTLPGVDRVALGTLAPWREAGSFGPGFQFTVEGYQLGPGEDDPHGRFRTVSPGFFAALGVPLLAGRDFDESDRKDAERRVIL